MPPKSDFATIGKVSQFGDAFLAHVQHRDQNGVKKHIYGPSRSDEAFAQKDLARMRAAAAVGKDRAQGFEIMTMEAWKIKNEAEYAAQIRATVLPDATEPAPEEEYEPGSGSEFDEEEPWLATFVDKKPMEPPEEEEEMPAETPSQRPELTPIQATKELVEKFRPRKALPADLEHLLSCRADPNAPAPPGRGTPLAHVIWFAHEEHRPAMRQLLLKHGAIESKKEADDWALRQRAALCEKVRLSEHAYDPRKYDPVAATLERGV